MAKLSLRPSSKTVVTLGVILGLVIAAGGFLCAMQAKELSLLSDELESNKAKLVAEKELSKRLESALADLEEAKREVVHLEEGVIEPDYIPTLLMQLDDLAGSAGLTVEGITVEEEKAKAPPRTTGKQGEDQPEGTERGVSPKAKSKAASSLPYKERTLSVEVKGGFERVVEFVKKLTRFPKIVSVDDIKVDPSKDRLAGGDPALDVTISLKVYIWQRAERAEKAAESG